MPSYIFLDTNVFVRSGFLFRQSEVFRTLAEAVEQDRVRVVMPDVAMREVASNIAEAVREAIGKAKGLKELRGLTIVDFDAIHQLDEKQAVADILDQWQRYQARLQPIIIDINRVKPTDVMDAFFEKKPPFSPGKRYEFKDAFMVEALRSWAREHSQQVIVVTGDKRFAEACDGTLLKYEETLANALIAASAGTPVPGLRERLRSVIAADATSGEGADSVLLAMLQIEFPCLVSFANDYGGDVDFVGLYRVDPDVASFRILRTEGEQVVAAGDVSVRFEVEVDSTSPPADHWTVASKSLVSITLRIDGLNDRTAAQPRFHSLQIEHPQRVVLRHQDVELSGRGGGVRQHPN